MKQNVNFNFKPPTVFVILVYHKSDLIKICLSSEDQTAYKISWFHVDWCKFWINLKVRTSAILEWSKIWD
jgi:hypothetical protein